MDNIRALVIEIASARRTPLTFLDLNDDCLRVICDHFDLEHLLAIASTCRRLQTVARDIFEQRYEQIKIVGLQESKNEKLKIELLGTDRKYWIRGNELRIHKIRMFRNVLTHFGNLFDGVAIIRTRNPGKVIKMLRHFHWKQLYLFWDYDGFGSIAMSSAVMKRLSKFHITFPPKQQGMPITSNNLPFAFDSCAHLTILELINVSADNIHKSLGIKFSQLLRLELRHNGDGTVHYVLINQFLETNQQLIEFKFNSEGQFIIEYNKSGLKNIIIYEHFCPFYKKMPPLRSLYVISGKSHAYFAETFNELSFFRENVDLLKLFSSKKVDYWTFFKQMRKLQVLVGQNHFGENTIQEFSDRLHELIGELPRLKFMFISGSKKYDIPIDGKIGRISFPHRRAAIFSNAPE